MLRRGVNLLHRLNLQVSDNSIKVEGSFNPVMRIKIKYLGTKTSQSLILAKLFSNHIRDKKINIV